MRAVLTTPISISRPCPTQDLRLPRSSKGCCGWPTTCTGRGTQRCARSSRASTARCGRASAALSPCCARRATGSPCSTTLTSWSSTRPSSSASTVHGQRRRALVRAPPRLGTDGPGGVLLRRVRPPRDAAHLLGRPGRAGRRPLQDRLGHGAAVRRRRASSTGAATSARSIDADGHQEHDYVTLDPARPAAACGSGLESATRSSCPVELPGRTVMAAVWLAQVGRVPAAPARHGRARERRARPAHQPHPLRARPRDAPAPGARPRRRRRARAARSSASSPPPGTSTRATRPSCSSSRPASSWPRASRSRTRWRRVRRHSVFTDPHARAGRQRALRGRPRAHARGARASDGSGLDLERIVEHGRGRGRRRRASST